MLNLLSQEEKKVIKGEYARRRAVLIFAFVALSAAVAAVFLVPSYIVIRYKLGETLDTAETLKQNIAVKNKADLDALITMTNKKMSLLAADPGPGASSYLSGIVSAMSPDIKITSFALGQVGKEKKSAITVRGLAGDRESLLGFVSRLKSDPAYGSVDLPISNFADETNIKFTVTLIFK